MSEINDSMNDFLNGCHYATLGTLNENGSIHLTTVWYLFDNEKFYFVTGSSARKARNVASRPEASVVVDSRRNQGNECSVSASGSVELITGEESKEINMKIIERYLTKDAMEDPNIAPGFEAAGEAVICLTPQKWSRYEFKDVDNAYFGGVLGQSPEKWFNTVD